MASEVCCPQRPSCSARTRFASFLLCALGPFLTLPVEGTDDSSGSIASSSELELGLTTQVRFGHFDEQEDGDLFGELELIPSATWTIGEQYEARFEARLRVLGGELLGSGSGSLRSFSTWSQPLGLGDRASLELREAVLSRDGDRVRWAVGKQQVVWGEIDGFKVLDAVNPQSFREFILEDFGSSRIPLWSVVADWKLGRWRLETVWAPDATVHELAQPGSAFEFNAPRFRFEPPEGFRGEVLDEQRDDLSLATYAARLKTSVGGWDASIVGISGVDPEPLARLERSASAHGPTDMRLVRFHERRDLVGFSLTKAMGPIALRTEAAWRPSRRFNVQIEHPHSPSLETRKLDQSTLALAMDWQAPRGWFVNLQVVDDRVEGTHGSQLTLARPTTDRFYSFFARRSFRYDTLTLEARWYGGRSEVPTSQGKLWRSQGTLSRLSLEFLLDDLNSLRLEVDRFSGDGGGRYGEVFGQFERSDRVVFVWRHAR